MPLFSKVFRSKDSNKKSSVLNANGNANSKPQWVDSWLRTRVDPEEVAELIHGCTQELKSRALDVPFLLLPFRPSSDPSAARTFVRNYFIPPNDRPKLKGDALIGELRMTEVMVLISVMKWCWARLPGGVISWETYQMFKVGEKDMGFARDSFQTFIPISVDSKARVGIINDFFDLIAALAAHGKTNGLSGHKVSRFAGWWAFEHYDTGKGFEAGYKAWDKAATATTHLFFAYLRSASPEPGKTNGVLELPRSLQQLEAATNYPPPASLLSNDTTKVVMVVDVVSPTPYSLLRRAKNFEYRDDDHALQQFAAYDDPVDALTDECRRVLRAISTTNQSHVSDAKTSTSLADPSWSRFEDIGFSSALDDVAEDENGGVFSFSTKTNPTVTSPTRSPVMDLNRPTTPSWADFLSSGFTDENGNKAPSSMLLPPDKMLPPINTEPRGQSSQSHRRNLDTSSTLEPGELASITKMNIDDSFWWVWITSLAGEEPTSRKACFGRCALVETNIPSGRWMIMEEQVKGAAPEPVQGAYIAEKKGFLGFTTKNGRLTRRRSGVRKSPLSPSANSKSDFDPSNSAALAPDQQAKIHKAAMEAAKRKKAEESLTDGSTRRGRFEDAESKTNSVFTLGFKDEASPALQWAKQYDKNTIRAQYLGNQLAGKGSSDFLTLPQTGLNSKPSVSTLSDSTRDKELPTVPGEESESSLVIVSKTVSNGATPLAPKPSETRATSQLETRPAALPAPTVVEPTPLPVQHNAPMTIEPSVEAAVVALPPPTPEPERVEALPEVKAEPSVPKPPSTANSNRTKSSSPEQARKRSGSNSAAPVQRPSGIKRILGTMRKNREEKPAPPPPQSNPAVAAARRALEGKMNSPAASNSVGQSNAAKYKDATTPTTSATTATTATKSTVLEETPKPAPGNIESASVSQETAGLTSVNQPEDKFADAPEVVEDSDHLPPKTRRDEEFDQLSRVDTREREHADEEFSRFDQGPLLDQPAAMPMSYHSKAEGDDDATFRSKHQSVYSAVTMQTEDTEEEEEEEEEEEDQEGEADDATPNDRWAQIRRNAAERAARFSDDHGTRSRTETRTDDGETSGEETIESRVARIKARVAELTGNMEGVRK